MNTNTIMLRWGTLTIPIRTWPPSTGVRRMSTTMWSRFTICTLALQKPRKPGPCRTTDDRQAAPQAPARGPEERGGDRVDQRVDRAGANRLCQSTASSVGDHGGGWALNQVAALRADARDNQAS